MTRCVIEAGPVVVRGPNHADYEWVSAAIDGIDDELTLVDETPLNVDDVWRRIMHDVSGGPRDTITVVCPTWWPRSRVERVRDAAGAVADDVVLLRRSEVPREDGVTLVEVAPDLVVVSSRAGVEVLPRNDFDARESAICRSTTVVLDVPEGVEIGGVAANVADRDWVRDALATPPPQCAPPPSTVRRWPLVAAGVGTLLSVAALGGGLVANHGQFGPRDNATTLVVEGRVGVMAPARWRVQRVTSGPGSARVQLISPDDADVAVHITQSGLPQPQSLEQLAGSLRAALSEEPEGVFVDFRPVDSRADRAVVTYREMRRDHFVSWFVFTDTTVRIAIGCQSALGHEEAVREACDQAVRSAHAVF